MALTFLNGGGLRRGPLDFRLLDTPMVCRMSSAAMHRHFSRELSGTSPGNAADRVGDSRSKGARSRLAEPEEIATALTRM